MKKEPKKEKSKVFTINAVDESAIRAFDDWASEEGFRSRRAAFYRLTNAMSKDRLPILDRVTKEILVGDAADKMMLQARLAARREARNVLYEEGFISDPAEPSEVLRRAKP